MNPSPLRLEVHETLKEKIEADSIASGRSINDLVRTILYAEFRLSYQPTNRKGNGFHGSNQLSIPVSVVLHNRIERVAAERQAARRRETGTRAIYSKNELVERILCGYYGVDYVPRPSGRPRRVATPV